MTFVFSRDSRSVLYTHSRVYRYLHQIHVHVCTWKLSMLHGYLHLVEYWAGMCLQIVPALCGTPALIKVQTDVVFQHVRAENTGTIQGPVP